MLRSSLAPSAVVVGAGLGGLAAAITLATRGVQVVVAESLPAVGGKMRRLEIGGHSIDAGPTVLTLPEVLAELFERSGQSLADHLRLEPLSVLARHHWKDGSRLDLMADREDAAVAIERFAGAREADGYLRFCAYTHRLLETLEDSFIRSADPSFLGMVRSLGLRGLSRWSGVDWHRTMWRSLDEYFRDPRLHQLFARYATYTGSSPATAPATLNLVAAVEQRGVYRVTGGMYQVAEALAALAIRLGVQIRCSTPVRSMVIEGGRCRGVRIADEELLADFVVFNGDRGALPGLVSGVSRRKVPGVASTGRSFSAHTIAMVARATGSPLEHHNVLFSSDYRREFEQLAAGGVPDDPTVYVCAQDRPRPVSDDHRRERLLILANASARGDEQPSLEEPRSCKERIFDRIRSAGIELTWQPTLAVETCPRDFARLFPGSGGALYGVPNRGWIAAFRRGGAKSKIPGLYLAGGGVHPGAGVPMVLLSGGFAATSAIDDLSSMHRWFPGAIAGGTRTESPTTVSEHSR